MPSLTQAPIDFFLRGRCGDNVYGLQEELLGARLNFDSMWREHFSCSLMLFSEHQFDMMDGYVNDMLLCYVLFVPTNKLGNHHKGLPGEKSCMV